MHKITTQITTILALFLSNLCYSSVEEPTQIAIYFIPWTHESKTYNNPNNLKNSAYLKIELLEKTVIKTFMDEIIKEKEFSKLKTDDFGNNNLLIELLNNDAPASSFCSDGSYIYNCYKNQGRPIDKDFRKLFEIYSYSGYLNLF